ncbi:MAG: hypothetical protein ABI882_24050 [Acidobacteriota bacterium]
MVEPPFGALLMASIGVALLLATTLLSAPLTAISVTAIAARANEEEGAALLGPAKPLT